MVAGESRDSFPELPPFFPGWVFPFLVAPSDDRRQLIVIGPRVGYVPEAGEALCQRLAVVFEIGPALTGLVPVIVLGKRIAFRPEIFFGELFAAGQFEKLAPGNLAPF